MKKAVSQSKSKAKVIQKKAKSKPVRKKKKDTFKEHPLSSSEMFNNREIGWLNFNLRVLAEAKDPQNPVLERLKFLAISSSNLDEFFMKRVGGLKRQIAYGLSPKSSDGQTPKKQLAMIAKALEPMLKSQQEIYHKLRLELHKENVHVETFDQLNESERVHLKKYFLNHIYPILTPLSVDPGHPFPFISNLSTSLGISLVQEGKDADEKIFARLKIPKLIDQWVQIRGTQKYIHLIDIVKQYVNELFPEMKVMGTVVFKVTRNADSDREDEDAEDLLATIEEELRQRRFAEIVRIEFGSCTDEWLKTFLIKELDFKNEDIHPLPVDFDFNDLQMLVQTLSEELPQETTRYSSWSPIMPANLQDQNSIFSVIDKQDILLHHPFESFSASVERFVSEASEDPMVLAIKMTLYRTGDNSPFIKSLIRAAENGKQVVCLIELKARFDEERNIYWAQELENAGVHVVYGLVGLKTHAKTTLIVRKTFDDELKTYAHVGTGNYNVVTSRFYTDVGLLTCHPEITQELMAFFNYLTGKSLKKDYQHLLIAPINMFQKFKDLIRREVNHVESGRPGLIMAKFNNMEENDITSALYAASEAHVQIQLIVRGFCCVKPEERLFSKNIKVQSTLGRFLEHSRIFYFRNGSEDPIDGDFYIGSADWMYRNLHARVEAICPVYDRQAKEKLWDILQTYWNDKVQTWSMHSDGSYLKKRKQPGDVGVQKLMMEKALVKTNLTEDDYISSHGESDEDQDR
ncbi:MAG: polyphosphate kinase 1 [Moraxellaceae bacterium]|nr:polyphosphate kinase 1 [Pseudobdellovibrionaceae bacterium]